MSDKFREDRGNRALTPNYDQSAITALVWPLAYLMPSRLPEIVEQLISQFDQCHDWDGFVARLRKSYWTICRDVCTEVLLRDRGFRREEDEEADGDDPAFLYMRGEADQEHDLIHHPSPGIWTAGAAVEGDLATVKAQVEEAINFGRQPVSAAHIELMEAVVAGFRKEVPKE